MIDRSSILHDTSAASWGSIFAGAVTVVAVSILLSLLGAAFGLGMVEAQTSTPVDGIATAFGIWSAISLLISLAAGGFVAGYLAGEGGWVHGFLSWATALIFAVVVSAFAVSGAVQLAGSAIGSVASLTGSAASSIGGLGADAVQSLVDDLDPEMLGDIDFEVASADIQEALGDAEVAALQPENLQEEMAAARQDVEEALSQLASNPTQLGAVSEQLVNDLTDRLESVVADIDRDAIVAALSENTDLTQAEAEEAADTAIERYEELVAEMRAQIENAQQAIAAAGENLAQLEEEARQRADAAAEAASSAALWAFFAALIGAVVSAGAGLFGSRFRDDHY